MQVLHFCENFIVQCTVILEQSSENISFLSRWKLSETSFQNCHIAEFITSARFVEHFKRGDMFKFAISLFSNSFQVLRFVR